MWQLTGDLNHNLQNSTPLQCNVPWIPQLFLVWIRQITLVCQISANGLRLSSTILLHNSVRLHLTVLDYSDNYLHICGIKPWRRYTYLSHLYKTYECNCLSLLQFSFHKPWWHHGPQTKTGRGGGRLFEPRIKKHFHLWITRCAQAY